MSANRYIVGLDLATNTGYSLVRGGRVVSSGTLDLTRHGEEHYGHMFLKLWDFLSKFNREGLTIAYELAHHRGGAPTRIGVGLNSTCLHFCAKIDAPLMSVRTITLKKWFTGNAKAKKPEMCAVASKYVGRKLDPDFDNDEGDAIAVGLYAWEQIARKST